MTSGTLPANSFNVLALVNEIELFPTWIPTIRLSKYDYHISDFRKLIYFKVCPPKPVGYFVSEREMCLYAYGVDMMEDNRLYAIVRTPTNDDLEDFKTLIDGYAPRKIEPSPVRMHCYMAGIEIIPIGEDKTKVTLVTCVDVKMMLPYWVINIATKQFAHMILGFLGDKAANLPDEYKKRINSNGSVYQNIKDRLRDDNDNNSNSNGNSNGDSNNNNNQQNV